MQKAKQKSTDLARYSVISCCKGNWYDCNK